MKLVAVIGAAAVVLIAAAARPTRAPGRVWSIVLVVEMDSGDTRSMRATINADASVTDRTEIWKSGDTSVVRVDQRGTFVAIRPGRAYVTVKARADTTRWAGFWVNVNRRQR